MPTTVVVPTVGRPSLHRLLRVLSGATPQPAEILVVDDRPGHGSADGSADGSAPLDVPPGVRVLRSGGRGPAAARNVGWRASRTPWVSFLDDDVEPDAGWLADLGHDLGTVDDDVAGSQGRVRVPLPRHRRPTDDERGTAGLEHAAWITADMTYRRSALAAVDGFDERFHRAYREDADIALRIIARGGRIVRGGRRIVHPVRPSGFFSSVRSQAGNADDMLMRRLHGPGWRDRAQAGRGRKGRHAAITAAGGLAVALAAAGRRRAALAAALAWGASTAEFAATRIGPGPRTAAEVIRMVVTSVLIPPAATWHTARGWLRYRHLVPWSSDRRPAREVAGPGPVRATGMARASAGTRQL
ncbi:glycosyltransferase [Phytoactinopolyspora halotolerans]|uniref:Glycosyltransferase n=1 Tax=Phytoactinopolyspora halotolerans TaxID=1981512 RepID=A0A6L9SAP0_9ACTN|nr:glycosyltransferase [Phytoactinopolyspora halotolerans]